MDTGVILDIVRDGVWTILWTAAPPLIMGVSVGIAVSIFQTVTSIQEPTLAFVPKIIAVMMGLVIFGPYMLGNLTDFFMRTVERLPDIIRGVG